MKERHVTGRRPAGAAAPSGPAVTHGDFTQGGR